MKIDSGSIVDHLDSIIIHLAKVLAVEHQCTNEEAIKLVQKVLIGKAKELSASKEDNISAIVSMYKAHVQSSSTTTLERAMYTELSNAGLLE